jgi:hypothetical protein
LKKKFGQVRQILGVSIGEFKREFDLQCEGLLGAGIAATPQPVLALLFLDKLDQQRYAGMLAQLTNDATLGRIIHKPYMQPGQSPLDGRQLSRRLQKAPTCNLYTFSLTMRLVRLGIPRV